MGRHLASQKRGCELRHIESNVKFFNRITFSPALSTYRSHAVKSTPTSPGTTFCTERRLPTFTSSFRKLRYSASATTFVKLTRQRFVSNSAMDADDHSLFENLCSPSFSLLDSKPLPQSTADEIDIAAIMDPGSNWDRALAYPLPPPSLPHDPARFTHNLPPSLAWLESHESVHQNAHAHNHPTEDDNSSVDDTSPVQPNSPSSTAPPSKTPSKQLNHTNKTKSVLQLRPNISHTRRCREKVNTNFDRLLAALPAPPPGVEVKHKAQILAYTIDYFHFLRRHNMKLEMQLALSSPYQMQRWVRSVVSAAPTLSDALKPFMALICLTKQWKYAELWMPYTTPGNGSSTALKYITGALPPTVEGDELSRLRTYRKYSRKYVFHPRSGVPGRVFLTMRPEWLPLLDDPVAFPRAPHAVQNKVEVTFAVPVIVNGSVQMVVEFYDTARREYDPEVVNVANDIANLLGKTFAGHKKLNRK